MTDAREWLRDTLGASHPGDEPRMRDALLAVLDECDRLDREADDLAPRDDWGESIAATVQADAQRAASACIRDAIDKALSGKS